MGRLCSKYPVESRSSTESYIHPILLNGLRYKGFLPSGDNGGAGRGYQAQPRVPKGLRWLRSAGVEIIRMDESD